jgi:MFS transporter, OFA family, oxalate/formate antiporter
MASNTVSNRWMVVLGAILIQVALGAIYAWSVFTPALTDAAGLYKFTATQTMTIFSVGLAAFAIVTIIAGRLMAKFPAQKIAITGGITLGVGYILAGFVGPSFIGLVLTIGLIGGIGIGLGYVVPIAVGVKWFPDKKGLLTGLAVAGFGLGAFLWIMAGGRWGHLIATYGVDKVFQMYGVAFIVMVLIGSIWMVPPPEGYKPEGWNPPPPAKAAATGAVSMTSAEMLRTPQFYMLWFMFIAGALAGLMVIGNIKLFGIDALKAGGMDETLAKAKTDVAMAVYFALANAAGRIIWGMVSDKIGRKTSLFAMFVFQGVMLLLFYSMGGTETLFYLGALLIGFNFGGNFALFPAATADFFGNKTVGLNYGWVFTAYGVGGIVGPILAGHFKDQVATAGITAWQTPFMVAGVVCLVAAVISLALKAPNKTA